jgi:hypothetical protein
MYLDCIKRYLLSVNLSLLTSKEGHCFVKELSCT